MFAFLIGSIPFFLARTANSGEIGASIRLTYDHKNAAARGGVLFFAGSLFFLVILYCARNLSLDQVHDLESIAYSLYAWGRVEFFIGTMFNATEICAKLDAAAAWHEATTGCAVRYPNLGERLIHLICGKKSPVSRMFLNPDTEPKCCDVDCAQV